MNLFLFGQIMGICGAMSMIISSWQKTRKNMLLYLVFDNIFYFLQYIFLGAYSGAFTSIVSLFRNIVFSQKNKNKFFSTNIPLIAIIFIYAIINIFTYNGISSLFPAIAAIIYAIVLWQDDPKNIRKGSSIMLLMWFIYNLVVKAYVGAIMEFILFISSLIAIIKIDIINSKNGGTNSNEKTK